MPPRGFASVKVADLMSAPVTVPASATAREVAIFLARAGTAAVPVVSRDGGLLGIVGETEIHELLSVGSRGFYPPAEFRTGVPFLGGPLPDAMWHHFSRVGSTPAGELARKVEVVRPHDFLVAAIDAMQRQALPALPVVERGEVVGILHADALTFRLVEFALPEGAPRP